MKDGKASETSRAIYIYIYIYIILYIYIYIYIMAETGRLADRSAALAARQVGLAESSGEAVRSFEEKKTSHQKSTPQKSSWISSGAFQWVVSGIFQRILTFPVDFTGIVQWIVSGIFE